MNRRSRYLPLAAVALLLLTLIACGGKNSLSDPAGGPDAQASGSATPAAEVQIPVTLTKSGAFEPATASAQVGTLLIFAIANEPGTHLTLSIVDKSGGIVALLGALDNFDKVQVTTYLPLRTPDGKTRLSAGLPAGVYTIVAEEKPSVKLTLTVK